MREARGGEVYINLEDHRHEEFVQVKKAAKAFSGSGHTLGRFGIIIISLFYYLKTTDESTFCFLLYWFILLIFFFAGSTTHKLKLIISMELLHWIVLNSWLFELIFWLLVALF